MKKLDIIYEDKEIIVVNKPSGLLCIATNKKETNTLYRMVSSYIKKSNPRLKIYIVHRLDKDTSGIVVFAKSQTIKLMLQNNWDKIATKRKYIAVVEGEVEKERDTIKSYLKETKTLLVYSTKGKDGKLAITEYRKIFSNKNYSLLDITIKTGRKNQIRVHMKDINHIIVGDKKYGCKKNPIRRMCLHANILEILHPVTHKLMHFETDIPDNFIKLINN